jgi:uncharacterized membrane protein YkvA (DUF1232 family)
MRYLNAMKTKAKALKKEITALYYAYQDPHLSVMPKLIILVTLGYALSPIDLIPDFIPILGYLDDLIILPALIVLSLKLIPRNIMAAARLRAENEPIRLKDNWVFALVFIMIWLLLIASLVALAIKVLGR